MKSLTIVYILALAQYARSKPSNISVKQFVELVNSKQSTWKAGGEENRIEYLASRSRFLGLDPDPSHKIPSMTHIVPKAGIPESFDARDHWATCTDVISNIRDQGKCGSCWAFASAEVMSDRLCIQTNGETKFEFAAQDVLSCCVFCGSGCFGGYATRAWDYFMLNGIVSGGDYNSNKGCRPYEELAFINGTRSACTATCSNPDYESSYFKDKRYGESYYKVSPDVEQIQAEIMTNGPVQASYKVYADFGYYEEGVYQRVDDGDPLGSHAVKIIGWGMENSVPYWLVANSWGTDWAKLGGYFKIKRGTNECGIEESVLAGVTYTGSGYPTDDPPPGGSSIKLSVTSTGLLLSCWLVFYVLYV